jgi:hypothetical protein
LVPHRSFARLRWNKLSFTMTSDVGSGVTLHSALDDGQMAS